MSSATAIRAVNARKIFDSRGSPTIEVEITTAKASTIVAAPSGKSVGKFEAAAFPKGGVDEAIALIKNGLSARLVGHEAADQNKIDVILREFDGTSDFSKIGGNAAYAVSIGCAFAAAKALGKPPYEYLAADGNLEVPFPLGNVVGGGLHASVSPQDIQEILLLPIGARNPLEAAQSNAKVHEKVQKNAGKDYHATGKGDEGAWVLDARNKRAFEIVRDAVEKVEDEIGTKIALGADMAASSLWNETTQLYDYKREGISRNIKEHYDFVTSLIDEFGLAYLEDPFHEEDFNSFRALRSERPNVLVCGDDLIVTNPARLKKAIDASAVSAIIVKPNQVGTLTDTREVTMTAKRSGIVPVISHRSGETTGAEISHIAVGYGSPILKCGIVGGERTAKINELLRIWERSGGERGPLRMARIKLEI